jgi:hypothetical protein
MNRVASVQSVLACPQGSGVDLVPHVERMPPAATSSSLPPSLGGERFAGALVSELIAKTARKRLHTAAG